ncbi:hypothetical protein [Salsuginibacillus kocurii]|uniref:hypothetical protein n=1 Tax=Salsuginibacillus kocurii TaxID=427078 RepID=UPI00037B3A00|nr:hypothetical protein [Salsuginibacillus kocurii]
MRISQQSSLFIYRIELADSRYKAFEWREENDRLTMQELSYDSLALKKWKESVRLTNG